MDLGQPLTTYERPFAHAWGARVVLLVLSLFFVVLFALLPAIGPLLALAGLAGIGWFGFKTFVGARVKLTVFENGFRWEGKTVLEGPWSAIKSVNFNQANVLVSGVQVSHNMSLGVTLESGERFDLMTREEQGRRAILHFMDASRPFVEQKLANQQLSGGPLDFGELSLDGEALTHKGRRYPWASLNGYRLDQGHLMVDVNPDAPRMAFKVNIARISNIQSLLERLEQYLPTGDYDRFPLEDSKFSLLRTTAATHDPRYLTRGQRLMVLAAPLALVPLFIVYALISIPFALDHQKAFNQFTAEETQFDEAVAAKLEDMPQFEVPLAEACASADLKLSEEATARIGPQDPKLGFLTAKQQSFVTVIDDHRNTFPPMSLGDAMFELLGDFPSDWGRRAGYMSEKRQKEPFTAAVRVRHLGSPIRKGYGDWTQGTVTLDVSFVGRDGKVRCEGNVTGTYPKDVRTSSSEGDLWEQGVMATAILPVCQRMGPGFCEQAGQFAVLGMPAASAAVAPKAVKVAPPKKRRR